MVSIKKKRSHRTFKGPKVLLSNRDSDGEIPVTDRGEGGASEAVQAVDQDQRARQVLPAFGDGVPHPVQAGVELLDHVPVAVADVGGPGQQEVVGWLPHALRRTEESSGEKKRSLSGLERVLEDTAGVTSLSRRPFLSRCGAS